MQKLYSLLLITLFQTSLQICCEATPPEKLSYNPTSRDTALIESLAGIMALPPTALDGHTTKPITSLAHLISSPPKGSAHARQSRDFTPLIFLDKTGLPTRLTWISQNMRGSMIKEILHTRFPGIIETPPFATISADTEKTETGYSATTRFNGTEEQSTVMIDLHGKYIHASHENGNFIIHQNTKKAVASFYDPKISEDSNKPLFPGHDILLASCQSADGKNTLIKMWAYK